MDNGDTSVSCNTSKLPSKMLVCVKTRLWASAPDIFSNRPILMFPGVFIKHCVLEFQTLTFSQTVRLHSQWQNFVQDDKNWDVPPGRRVVKPSQDSSPLKQQDFTAAMKAIALSNCDGGKVVLDDVKLGTEALQLAAMHGRFGHQ